MQWRKYLLGMLGALSVLLGTTTWIVAQPAKAEFTLKLMGINRFTPEITAVIREVARTKIVPDWVRRAGGKEAAQLFDQIIAPLVGFPVAQQQ